MGALVVKLLWDDSDFTSGSKQSENAYKQVAGSFGAASVAAGNLIADAFKGALRAVEDFVTGVVSTGAAFEAQIDLVGAIGGATAKQLETLEAQSRQLGRDTVFSATEAAEAMTVLAQAGLGVEESINTAGDALKFAQAQGVGLEKGTELLVATMNQFQLQNLSAAEASDILTAATDRSQLDFSKLSNALRYAGPQAAAFGISLQETASALGAFADLGFRGTQAGTTFRHALAEVAAPSKKATAALANLGITVDEVNPKLVGYNGIIERLSRSNFEAADAVKVFGSETGPAIAAMVEATRAGVVDLRASTQGLADTAGSTDKRIKGMSDNVATQFRLLTSQLEDISLSIFEAINEPLQQALEALSPFLETIGEGIQGTADEIEGGLLVAVNRLAKALRGNGQQAADAVAGTLRVIANLASAALTAVAFLVDEFGALTRVIQSLGLGGVVEDMAALLSIAGALAAAVGLLSAALGAGSGVTAGFGTAVAALGGPIGALVAAVGLLTFGFIQYKLAVLDAKKAQEAFEEAQGAVQVQSDALLDKLTGGASIEDLRATSAAFVANFRSAEAAGREFSDQLKEQATALEALADQGDDAIRLKIESGDLVVAGGRLATVDALISQLDETGFQAVNESAATFRQEAARVQREVVRVQAALDEVQEKNRLSGGNQFDVLLPKFDVEGGEFQGGSATAAQAFIDEQTKRAEAAEKAADRIERSEKLAAARLLKQEGASEAERARQRENEANRRALEDGQTDKERIAAAEAAAKAIAAIEERAGDAAAKATLTPVQQVLREFENASVEVATRLAEFTSQSEAERLAVAEQAERALALLKVQALGELAKLEDKAEADRLKAIEQGVDREASFTRKGLTAVEQVRRDAAGALVDLEAAAADERVAIAAEFEAKIAQAEDEADRVPLRAEQQAALASIDAKAAAVRVRIAQSEADRIAQIVEDADRERAKASKEALDIAQANLDGAVDDFFSAPGFFDRQWAEILGKVRETAATEFPKITRFVLDFVKATGAAIKGVQGIAGLLGGLFSKITGGNVKIDAGAITGDVISAQDDAAQAVLDAQEKLAELRAEGDADPVDIAAAQDELATAETEAARLGTDQAGGDIVQTMIESAMRFVDTLAEQLPGIVDRLIEQAPRLIDTIVAALPQIVDALVDSIPGLIQVILDALPAIIRALLDGVIQIVDMLPDLVQRILEAVPSIIEAIMAKLPDLIQAVIAAIPDIVIAIIRAIPDIVIAIVRAIPEIAIALVVAVFTELIPALPVIAYELVKAIVEIIWTVVKDIATFLAEAILEAFTLGFANTSLDNGKKGTRRNVFSGVAEVLTLGQANTGFDPGDRKAERSAQGGIPFVARTANTLVHAGEGILTAAENRQRLLGAAPTTTRNPFQPAATAPASGGAPGGSWEFRIAIGDRDMDRFTVESDARGGLGLTNKSNRRKTGTRVGFKRPGR